MYRWDGGSWTTTLVPGTDKGVRLKSKLPKRHACAESRGCLREERRRFSVISHCGSK